MKLPGTALDQALERAGDAVMVVDADGRVVLWNRSAERTLGYTAREVLGRPCAQIFAGRDEHGNLLCSRAVRSGRSSGSARPSRASTCGRGTRRGARSGSTSAAGLPEVLTRREVEVLRLMASGLNTGAMADRLHVSRATVRNHIQHILAKLGVHSRLEAVAYANRHRLV